MDSKTAGEKELMQAARDLGVCCEFGWSPGIGFNTWADAQVFIDLSDLSFNAEIVETAGGLQFPFCVCYRA